MGWDDDALLNPFDQDLDEGRRQGRQEGLEAGYREGYELGQVTGLEYGMELGFMRGTVAALHEELRPSGGAPWLPPNKTERVRMILNDLTSLLDEFPGPFDVFHGDASVESNDHHEEDEDDGEEAQSQRSHQGNVRVLLQKIRAKFKLLTVVLGIPHFSLTQVMDEAADASKPVGDASNAPMPSEW